jgi:hypothetical protein
MPCTLIIGRDEDLCSQLVRERLLAGGRQVIYLPENQLFPGLDFAWDFDGRDSHGRLGLTGRTVHIDDIDGVLARCYGIATDAEGYQTKNGQYLSSEWHALLRGYLRAFTCPVINNLRSELWYKPHLLPTDLAVLVPGTRFKLPRSMVTTRIEDARCFFTACGNRLRYSPLTLSSNYVLETEDDIGKLESLSPLMPLFLSEIVPGDSVNAFVVGHHVIFDPPGEYGAIGRQCAAVAARLGVTFCTLQLVKTADADWYCLAADLMPTLYECADRVRDAIVDRLAVALGDAHGGTL